MQRPLKRLGSRNSFLQGVPFSAPENIPLAMEIGRIDPPPAPLLNSVLLWIGRPQVANTLRLVASIAITVAPLLFPPTAPLWMGRPLDPGIVVSSDPVRPLQIAPPSFMPPFMGGMVSMGAVPAHDPDLTKPAQPIATPQAQPPNLPAPPIFLRVPRDEPVAPVDHVPFDLVIPPTQLPPQWFSSYTSRAARDESIAPADRVPSLAITFAAQPIPQFASVWLRIPDDAPFVVPLSFRVGQPSAVYPPVVALFLRVPRDVAALPTDRPPGTWVAPPGQVPPNTPALFFSVPRDAPGRTPIGMDVASIPPPMPPSTVLWLRAGFDATIPASTRPLHLAPRSFTFVLNARSLTLDLSPRTQTLTLPDRED